MPLSIPASCLSLFFFHLPFSSPCPASPLHIVVFVSAPYFRLLLCFFSLAFFVSLSSLSPTHCCVCEFPVFSPLTFFSLSRALFVPFPIPTSCQCIAVSARFFCATIRPNLSPTIAVSVLYPRFSLFHCPESRPSAVCTSPLQSQTSKCPSLAPIPPPPSSNQAPPLRQRLPPKH